MPIQNADNAYAELRPVLSEGEVFTEHHLKVRARDVARYALLPGSHLRGKAIAERLEDARVVGATRGYYVYTGYHQGARLTVCSTGMGGPAVAIAMEELGRLGTDTFIRVGTAGAWQPLLREGALVVATAAARFGGTAKAYLPVEFPAVADHGVVAALLSAARHLELRVHHGVCATRDAFYVPWDESLRARLQTAGVLASEMEADTVLVVGSARGWRCGTALVIASSGLAPHVQPEPQIAAGEASLIELCLQAVAEIAASDAQGDAKHGYTADPASTERTEPMT